MITSSNHQKKTVSSSGGLSLFLSCLLGARARTSSKKETGSNHQKNPQPQMIVAASCGTKNNNASLQSNN